MTKTTNYQLPQWEAADPVRREDFNEAFAALDGAFSPDNLPYVFGSITIPAGDETNIELVTFPFKPSAILFVNGVTISMYTRGLGNFKLIPVDASQFTGVMAQHHVTLYFNGNKLILSNRNTTYGGTVYYMAFR